MGGGGGGGRGVYSLLPPFRLPPGVKDKAAMAAVPSVGWRRLNSGTPINHWSSSLTSEHKDAPLPHTHWCTYQRATHNECVHICALI